MSSDIIFPSDVSFLFFLLFEIPLVGFFHSSFRQHTLTQNKHDIWINPLIFSGDHLLLECDPRLTTLRYLAPIVRQFVKFHDVPEVERKHCSTIREVPRHAGN